MYSVTVGDSAGVANNRSLSFDGVNDIVNCGSTLQLSTALSLSLIQRCAFEPFLFLFLAYKVEINHGHQK